MELFNRIKKNKKGFTLVEIIVVLVILAILAAFTIPTMLGFVNDARSKAAIAEQREIYVAAQAITTEHVAKKDAAALGLTVDATTGAITAGTATNLGSAAVGVASPTGVALEMKNYLGGDIVANTGSVTTNSTWTVEVDAAGKVTKVTYTKNGVVLPDLNPSSAVK